MSADKSKGATKKGKKKTSPDRSGETERKQAIKAGAPGLIARARALFSPIPSWWPVVVFMAIGLGFRLSVTLWEPLIYPDSTQYMSLAREIRSGAFFSADFDLDQGYIKSRHLPPLYSFVISPFVPVDGGSRAVGLLIVIGLTGLSTGLLFLLLTRFASRKAGAVAGMAVFIPSMFLWRLAAASDLQTLAAAVSLTFSIATFVPFYLAAQAVFSRRAALIGCAILSFHPFVNWYASPILSEAVFTFLYTSIIAASAVALARPSYPRFILCGVIGALMYMTRDVGISAAPLIALAALMKLGLIDRAGWKRAAAMALIVVITFMAVSIPYFIHIRVRTGQWGLTAQMDNTSITEQVQAFGGDRYDRDKVRGKETGTGLIGDQPAKNFFELIALTPGLAKKTAVNMGLYGTELFRKWNALALALVVAGLFGIGREFMISRNREKLFLGGWVLVWILQLWALYALVTQYMVDNRYMYPLMFPGIMMAGQGISAISKWLAEPEKDKAPVRLMVLGFVFTALAFLHFFHLYLSVDPEPFKYFYSTYPDHFSVFLLFPLVGTIVVFMVSLWPFIGLIPRVRITKKILVWLGIILLIASILVIHYEDILIASLRTYLENCQQTMKALIPKDQRLTTPVIIQVLNQTIDPFFSAVVVAGAALALLLKLVHDYFYRLRTLLSRGLPVVLVGFVMAVAVPDFLDLHYRMSQAGLTQKYASGYKKVADDLKGLGLVPADRTICARKPFIAFYLQGQWFLDENKEPMPKSLDELGDLLSRPRLAGAGAGFYHEQTIDYLAVDSYTMRALRPGLIELSFGVIPMPGMNLIYSRYFPEFKRIITVYDCAQAEKPWPNRGSAAAHLARAEQHYNEKNPVFALQELQKAVEYDPRNITAWYNMTELLLLFYQLSYRAPDLELAPNVLFKLTIAANTYSSLVPGDEKARDLAQTLNQRLENLRKSGTMKMRTLGEPE